MADEIERKFLVNDKIYNYLYVTNSIYYGGEYFITQGYINGENTIRIRICGDSERGYRDNCPEAYFTLKGNREGCTRKEYEYKIDYKDAEEILKNVCGEIIEKERHKFTLDGVHWEIDIFEKENRGLIIAEVELDSEDQELFLPDFIEKEVTQDDRYYNYNLSKTPYKEWKCEGHRI